MIKNFFSWLFIQLLHRNLYSEIFYFQTIVKTGEIRVIFKFYFQNGNFSRRLPQEKKKNPCNACKFYITRRYAQAARRRMRSTCERVIRLIAFSLSATPPSFFPCPGVQRSTQELITCYTLRRVENVRF